MAKLEFTVSIFGTPTECKKLAKTMQTNIERSWVRANGRAKPTTTMLIGKNQIERDDPYCAFCKTNHPGGDTCMGHHP